MADRKGFTVHRLVQEITRLRLSDNEKHDTLDSAGALLIYALPSPNWDQKGWRLWEQLAPTTATCSIAYKTMSWSPKPLG
jgi:hypothetical protein